MELIQKRGHYEDPKTGTELTRVTEALRALNKPALVPWASKAATELTANCAADMHEQQIPGINDRMPRETYLTALKARIGPKRADERLLKTATEIGGAVHKRIEWTLRRELGQEAGPEPELPDNGLWAFMAWQDWKKTVNLEPLAIEQTVWSWEHGYAGTMDLFARLDIEGHGRQQAIIDWKTGAGLYAESDLQNAAYRNAWFEMGQAEPPVWGLIVRLPKQIDDPEFETKLIPPEDQDRLFGVYKSLLHVYKWWDEEEKKSLAKWKQKKQAQKASA